MHFSSYGQRNVKCGSAYTICMEFPGGIFGTIMEQTYISCGKTGSKNSNAVPFVKIDPVELSRLGQLMPRFTKSAIMGERMALVRFLQMVAYSGHFG